MRSFPACAEALDPSDFNRFVNVAVSSFQEFGDVPRKGFAVSLRKAKVNGQLGFRPGPTGLTVGFHQFIFSDNHISILDS